MRNILITLLGLLLITSCSPQRKLQDLVLKYPEVVLEHCIETYNPKITEITEIERVVYDTAYVEIDCTDTINIGRVVKTKCPPHEVIKETRTIEIEDTRKLDLLNIEYNKQLEKSIKYKTQRDYSGLANIILLALVVILWRIRK